MKTLLMLALIGGFACCAPRGAAAAAPVPSLGSGAVDGQCDEWNLGRDFFADMHQVGDPSKAAESKLYLRYDQVWNTLYVLILAQSQAIGCTEVGGGSAWAAIGTASSMIVPETVGNARVLPCYAWVGQAYDGDPAHAMGYEAAFHVTPGSYTIIAHIDLLDGGSRTLATTGFPGNAPALVIPEAPNPTQPASWGAIKAVYR